MLSIAFGLECSHLCPYKTDGSRDPPSISFNDLLEPSTKTDTIPPSPCRPCSTRAFWRDARTREASQYRDSAIIIVHLEIWFAIDDRQIVGTTSYLLQAGPSSSDHATACSEVPNHSPEIHILAQREPWQTMCVSLDFCGKEADRVREV